jgi:hypothetical protein
MVMQDRLFFVLPFILFFCISVSAQKATITFSEKEFDFGTIKEDTAIITHEFRFVNQGKVPLILNDVKSSCGCTVVEWSKEPILPKKSGIIKASFNPGKQAGSIYKTIQVISNADIPLVTLGIKGVVIPIQRVEEVYKFTIGDIRLQTIYVSFGEIYKGKSAKYTFSVFNKSLNQPATLTFRKVPAYLQIKVFPGILEPQQQGTIELTYESSQTDQWDFIVDRLEMLINGNVLPNNRISVTASIREDFSGLTAEQLALAARAVFDSHEFNFGTVSGNKLVEHSFLLTNTGKSDLLIRKITASCGCTAVQPTKTRIAPGESTEIKAIFNTKGREGNQKKAITVITNDPRQSRSILWINAVVQ